MPILLTKLRTVVYRATVVANARYRAATRKRHVKDILEIVSDSAMHDAKEAGPVADILLRRDQAVQKALEGVTLKSVVVESPSTIVKFPYPGSVAQSRRGIPQQRSNGD